MKNTLITESVWLILIKGFGLVWFGLVWFVCLCTLMGLAWFSRSNGV